VAGADTISSIARTVASAARSSLAGESLEPADCLHRRCGNPLHPAPHGPIGYAKQGSGIHLREPSPGEAGLRFRPVMMTSFAFILGLFPLVIAQGAGAITRHAVGTPVFGGMIAASLFGIFIIPPLYAVAEGLR